MNGEIWTATKQLGGGHEQPVMKPQGNFRSAREAMTSIEQYEAPAGWLSPNWAAVAGDRWQRRGRSADGNDVLYTVRRTLLVG